MNRLATLTAACLKEVRFSRLEFVPFRGSRTN